jgi:DNA-binding FadR family transcriptional regulator
MIMSVSAPPQTPLAARQSRAELVARELEREIAEGREAGERIGTKEDLRLRFGVAVATINEAVRLLEMRGAIEARPGPGGGVFVSPRSSRLALSHLVLGFRSGTTTYAETLEVRDALEPLICAHAARYHRAEDIRAMRKIVKQMEGTIDDPAAYFKANWALHRRIARLCRNEPLRTMYLMLIDFLEAEMAGAEIGEFDGDAFLKVHRDLVDAIDGGETPELEAAVEAHKPTQVLVISS